MKWIKLGGIYEVCNNFGCVLSFSGVLWENRERRGFVEELEFDWLRDVLCGWCVWCFLVFVCFVLVFLMGNWSCCFVFWWDSGFCYFVFFFLYFMFYCVKWVFFVCVFCGDFFYIWGECMRIFLCVLLMWVLCGCWLFGVWLGFKLKWRGFRV